MSIGSDLLRFSDRPILLFDFETSNVNVMQDNLPFECAFIVADKWGKVLEHHQHYLRWPDFRISVDAARITRFDPSWVRNGDDPREVLTKFESYLYDDRYIVSGHSILGFDCDLHRLWREQFGLKPDWSYQSRMVDTHLICRAYKEGWKPDRTNLLAWQHKVNAGFRKGIKTNLTLMAKELGVEIDESKTHGASYDLELNLGVYRKIMQKVEI